MSGSTMPKKLNIDFIPAGTVLEWDTGNGNKRLIRFPTDIDLSTLSGKDDQISGLEVSRIGDIDRFDENTTAYVSHIRRLVSEHLSKSADETGPKSVTDVTARMWGR